jgi:hypothetical protein
MRSFFINSSASAVGGILIIFAMCNSLMTLARGSYRPVLLTALMCSVLGTLFLSIPMIRGPWPYRVIAMLVASPAIFVWYDFAGRFPGS